MNNTDKRLLKKDPSLARSHYEYRTPLFFAVRENQLEVAAYLLEHGATFSFGNMLDVARDRGYTEMEKLLEAALATPHDTAPRGEAIAAAIRERDLGKVRSLLDADPSLVHAHDEQTNQPIHWAAMTRQLDMIDELLSRGADINIVKLLLEHGAYPSVEVESSADTLSAALGEAGYQTERNQEMVDLLCPYGAARPVHLLAHCNDLQTAAAVFAANPALADDTDALGSAGGHEAFIRLMLRYQPDLPKRRAIGGGTREITDLLFRHGMNPNHPNWLRITPLHYFAESGDVQNAAVFIEHGADVNAREEEFCSTPLGWAARCGKTRMVEFLLRHGAKLNLPDDLPWATPLAWATRRGHGEIARMLTEYEQTGALPSHSLEECETLAQALIEAYRSGEDTAMQRVMDHFQLKRPLTWDQPSQEVRRARLRRGVRGRLSSGSDGENESETLALTDAQLLVARSLGFKDWAELAKHIEG